jgi:hypothetical protein
MPIKIGCRRLALILVRVAIYVAYLRPMYSAMQHKESNPNTYLPDFIHYKVQISLDQSRHGYKS